jgi:hypothetical protein
VTEGAERRAVVIAMAFDESLGIDTDQALEQLMTALAGNASGTEVEERTISGQTVAVLDAGAGTTAIYHDGTRLIMVVTPSADDAVPVVTALIEANG